MDWNKLEMCWRDPKLKQENESRLAMDIKSAANPYSRVVSLMDQFLKQTKGKQLKTPTVLLGILEKHYPGKGCISLDVQKSALNVALRQKNSSVLNKVCHLYHLADSSLDFLPIILSLVENKKFNEACIAATALKLQDHFTIQDMVIPLFLQDKMQTAENYLKGHQDLQVQFILFLDGLLIDSRKPHSLANSLGVPDVKYEKLQVKTIGKLLARLLKVFDIPPDMCPNLCQVRGMGALKYLVNRRFIEGTVDSENWSDLLLGAVGTNKELQRELLSLLVSYNEAQEALKWAVHFKVERHLWPPVLEQILVQNVHRKAEAPVEEVVSCPTDQKQGGGEEEEVWELEDIAYLPFRLSRSDISIVETKEQFRSCLIEIQNYDVVALDAEWRPSFGMQQEKLSVLQMAVWDFVFLLDVQTLQGVLTQADWTQLIDCILCNPDIHKLSYGFSSDLKQLARIVPSAQAKLNKLQAMHDFSVLHPKFQVHCPELLVSSSPVSGRRPQESRGLSNLTLTTLGLPLDKSEQFSDWDKRPLKETQVLYAALDAYCLLQIFEVWHQRACDLGQDFFALAHKASHSSPSMLPASTSPRKGKQKQESPFINKQMANTVDLSRPVTAVSDLRLVVDTMLQGLGKYLRICGVDTHILETEDYHDEAAKVAQKEGRIILTSGAPYQQLKQHVPPGNCLNIPNGLSAEEQGKIIFRHFNVRLQKEDIFSRCCSCNGSGYVRIPSEALHQMWQRHSKLGWTKDASTPTSDKSQVSFPGGRVDLVRAVIDKKVSIQLSQLKREVFDRIQVFDVCASCGKVFWEGSHHGRTMKKMEPLLAGQETQPSCPKPVENFKHSNVEVVEPSLPATSSQNLKCNPKELSKSSLPPPPEFYSDDEDYHDDIDEAYM